MGAEVVTGHVEAVDHFGNILTTIPKTLLPATPFRVEIGQRSICCHVHSYGEMTPGHLVSLISSEGMLEVAQCNGNAAAYLSVKRGDEVRVTSAG